jgi:excisionase family DNA binding protein
MQQNIITSLTPDELRQIVVESVEHALKAQKQEPALPARRSMTVDEVSAYTGLSKQGVYIKTSKNEIPHSKRGKRLFFDRVEIDAWLLEDRRATTTEAEKQADDFLASNAARRTR